MTIIPDFENALYYQGLQPLKMQTFRITSFISWLFIIPLQNSYTQGLSDLSIDQLQAQGVQLMKDGQWQEANLLYETLLQKIDDSLGQSSASFLEENLNKIDILIALTNYQEAFTVLQASLDLFDRSVELSDTASAKISKDLALLNLKFGQVPPAIRLGKLSIEKHAIAYGQGSTLHAMSYSDLGRTYETMGQLEEALLVNLKAVELMKDSPDSLTFENLAIQNALGLTYQKLSQPDKAIPLFKKALQITEVIFGRQHTHYAAISSNLGIQYFGTNELDSTLVYVLPAIAYLQDGDDTLNTTYADLLQNLALVRTAQNLNTEAISAMERSHAILSQILPKQNPRYFASLTNLGRTYASAGAFEQSVPYQLEALQLSSESQSQFGLDHGYLNYNVASSLEMTDAMQDAAQYYGTFLDIMQAQYAYVYPNLDARARMNFLQRNQPYIDKAFSYGLKLLNSNPEYVDKLFQMSLQGKSLSLETSQEIDFSILADSNRDVYQKWEKLRKEIASAMTQSKSSLEEQEIVLSQLTSEAADLEAILFRESDLNVRMSIPFRDHFSSLGPGQAIIDFYHFEYHNGVIPTDSMVYIAMIFRTQMPNPTWVNIGDATQIEAALQKLNSLSQFNDGLADLSKIIWSKLQPHLKDVEEVFISGSGLIHRTPLSALPLNGKRVLHQFALHQVDHFRGNFLHKDGEVLRPELLLVGGVDFDHNISHPEPPKNADKIDPALYAVRSMITDSSRGGLYFQPLPGSRKEVDAIAELLQKRQVKYEMLTGEKAQEFFFHSTDLSRYKMVHFATHGYFFGAQSFTSKEGQTLRERIALSENPFLRSGLVLTGANHAWSSDQLVGTENDGIFTALEMANLDLSGTDLVVLSACETGLGDEFQSEGIYGLQRALKLAGVSNLIMSLWKVPDRETSELMLHFYRNLLMGKNVFESFQKAQIEMSKTHDPYYWAGFMLTE